MRNANKIDHEAVCLNDSNFNNKNNENNCTEIETTILTEESESIMGTIVDYQNLDSESEFGNFSKQEF